jgi:hypothetical protein
MSFAKHNIVKPALYSVVGASAFLGTTNISINDKFFAYGMEIPVVVALGLASGGASLLVDWAHSMVLPDIDSKDKLKVVEGIALNLGVSAGALLAVLYAMNPNSIPQLGLVKVLSVGALSELASQSLAESLNLD